MRRFILFFLLLFLTGHLSAEKFKKSGYNLGVLPAISFNSDLGLQYGAILNLFNYGDGSEYPAYDHSAYLEISRYTKGSGIYRLYYDSEKLIPGIRSFIELSYLTDDLMDFYGFNGYHSNYSANLPEKNRLFYKMAQEQSRLLVDMKGVFLTSHLYWVASYNFEHYRTGAVNYEKINKNISVNSPEYLQESSLYEKYIQWGIIDLDEAKGGILNTFKAGLIYDTRNALNNPDKGWNSEALLEIAPHFLNNFPYMRYSFTHCQYQSLIKNKLNAAIRLGVQGQIGGNNVPFFRRAQLISPFAKRTNVTGLGGSNSLRGILRNRVLGEDFALANLELRWKALPFRAINQNFYFGVNSFFDTGIILKSIDWNVKSILDEELPTHINTQTKDQFHSSFGGGIKVVMNENFIISAEVGKPLDKRDGGTLGTYINLNYLF